ncbi:MAG: type II secretion system protein [Verrucomicrobia bacterium]|nr:MAG: type II secretion system protein [Verrucomicrobiota bacterium]TAE85846.1 MAG: type II secretion system protein [Verrucomicrobiota bacterium]TAF23373.1 MAG: type II secretion system protein [Verrucomicrobiota bacterium]
MKIKRPQHGGFTLVELLVVIAIIAALAGFALPTIMQKKKAADRAEAINNVRQIGIGLSDFDSEYGSFPDNNTAEDVKEATGTSLSFGGTFSNDYFRQLIAAGGKSEKIFWCKTPYTPKKPDDVISPGKALDAGEVGFGYVMASQTDGQTSSGDPGRPLIVAPLYKAGTNWEFDPEPYGDKAIIFRLDQSAQAETIRTDNKYVNIGGNGRFLQTVGDNTPWGSDINPILRAPQPRGAGR